MPWVTADCKDELEESRRGLCQQNHLCVHVYGVLVELRRQLSGVDSFTFTLVLETELRSQACVTGRQGPLPTPLNHFAGCVLASVGKCPMHPKMACYIEPSVMLAEFQPVSSLVFC